MKELQKTHRLLFHIGTQQTRDTQLKTFFYVNQESLRKNGWYYPHLVEEMPTNYAVSREVYITNGWEIQQSFLGLGKDSAAKVHLDDIMACLARHLSTHSVIVSCEEFWPLDLEQFFNVMLQYHRDVGAIVYLRRQDQYAERLWREAVRYHGTREARSLRQYVEDRIVRGLLDYRSKLVPLHKLLGNRLVVRVLEKGALQGAGHDIVSDFCAVLGIGLEKEDAAWSRPQAREEKYGALVLAAKRLFNEVARRDGFPPDADELFGELHNILQEQGDAGGNCLSPSQREQILAQYEEGNREVAKKLLGKKDGKLFADMDTRLPWADPLATPMEEGILRLLFLGLHRSLSMVREQDERIRRLQGSLEDLRADMLSEPIAQLQEELREERQKPWWKRIFS